MTDRRLIFEAIDRERDFQDRKWGTIHGRPHEIATWLVILRAELAEAEQAWLKEGHPNALRELLQVVAVGVACLEQHGVYERFD